ncbi:MAG: DUF1648 domain-containing protein [Ruminococcus sp.]|nr:DUF1648 domain-containing protein [Ruminococcus sp.]
MMKTIKVLLLLSIAVLPLIVSLIALAFLPEQIPTHYGVDFTVDRYGSKFEALIFPITILILSLVFLLPGIFMKNELNKKLILDIGIALILAFNALDYYILYVQSSNLYSINSGVFAIERILLLILGVLFVFIGNLMPMSRKNSFIGLRTKWSMSNDAVWKKCQLFGGVSMMILGITLFVLAFVFPNIFLMIGLILGVVVIDTIYSYIAANRNHTAG